MKICLVRLWYSRADAAQLSTTASAYRQCARELEKPPMALFKELGYQPIEPNKSPRERREALLSDCSPILVVPRRSILTDGGTIWESQLFYKGWNELPPGKKVGRIIGAFALKDSKATVVDIDFPGCGEIVKNVFLDEITQVQAN